MAKDWEGCVVGDADMFDGVVEEGAIEWVLGDDNTKEYGAIGGRWVGGVGWFVESDFFILMRLPVWREGGVKGFYLGVDEVSKVLVDYESFFRSIFPKDEADADPLSR